MDKRQQMNGARPFRLRPGGDPALWIIAVILAVVSLLVVYSSTGALVRQFVIVAMGLVVIFGVHKVNYQFYGRVVWGAYVVALVFTLMVYFIGEVNPDAPDAPRWIRIPIVNFTFQPSDFLKVATVMVVARELARRQRTIADERFFASPEAVRQTAVPLLGPVALSCAAIFPTNLSTALILFGTCFVMLFIGRVNPRELAKLLGGVMLFAALGIGFLYLIGAPPQRMETWVGRFEAFAGGESGSDTYQVDQAKIAIAAGGLAGRGAGASIQRENLPLAESDYAYAFIIEEYGALIGGLGVMMLYLWIFFRAILIFRKCGTAFPSLLVLGLGLLITLQAMANMMVSTNLLPSTGLTLPLISKGGSSELFLSLALGMMLGVSRQTQEKTLDTPKAESLLEIYRN